MRVPLSIINSSGSISSNTISSNTSSEVCINTIFFNINFDIEKTGIDKLGNYGSFIKKQYSHKYDKIKEYISMHPTGHASKLSGILIKVRFCSREQHYVIDHKEFNGIWDDQPILNKLFDEEMVRKISAEFFLYNNAFIYAARMLIKMPIDDILNTKTSEVTENLIQLIKTKFNLPKNQTTKDFIYEWKKTLKTRINSKKMKNWKLVKYGEVECINEKTIITLENISELNVNDIFMWLADTKEKKAWAFSRDEIVSYWGSNPFNVHPITRQKLTEFDKFSICKFMNDFKFFKSGLDNLTDIVFSEMQAGEY